MLQAPLEFACWSENGYETHAAAGGYRSPLGPDVEVMPMAMIHGGSTSAGSCNLSSHGVHMPQDAMERIGDTIAGWLRVYWQDTPPYGPLSSAS